MSLWVGARVDQKAVNVITLIAGIQNLKGINTISF